jgi:hypothetical protein
MEDTFGTSARNAANNSWRFPVDNPKGALPLDNVVIQLALNAMAREPNILKVACDVADWFDECRAGALGG